MFSQSRTLTMVFLVTIFHCAQTCQHNIFCNQVHSMSSLVTFLLVITFRSSRSLLSSLPCATWMHMVNALSTVPSLFLRHFLVPATNAKLECQTSSRLVLVSTGL